MTTISDLIEERKNLSGIFAGAGGDRIPPHGTTHVKLGPDPIPQEIDGIPVDLEGINAGETIVLDAEGNLVPGAALGALVSLQTAYSNGATINATTEDLIFQIATGTKFDLRDAGGNPIFRFSDVASVATLLLSADVLTLKDSNTTTPIAIGGVGDPVFSTTKQSIIGAVNEVWTSVASLLAAPTAHASTHEDSGSDEINAGNLSGTGEIGKSFTIVDAITGNPDLKFEQRETALVRQSSLSLIDSPTTPVVANGGFYLILDGETGDTIYKIDAVSGAVVNSYSPNTAVGRQPMVVRDNTICILMGGLVYEVPFDTLDSVSSVTATGLDTPISREGALGPSGEIYTISSGDPDAVYILTRGATSYTVVKRTLSGITSGLLGICFDAKKENFFVQDGSIVRKFDVENRTLQSSSAALLSPYMRGGLGVVNNGDVCTVVNQKVFILDGTSLSTISGPTTSTVGGLVGCVYDSKITTATLTELSTYQIPGLTVQTPTHSDRSLQNSSSIAELRHKTTGARIYHSDSDFQRAAIRAAALDTTRLGIDVISSVSSTSSEITNAVVGQRYLISDASTLDNHVFEKRSDGPYWYTPSGTIFERERGIYHDWVDEQWVPRTDTVIRGTVTIPSGTAVGTWTSSHIQFNNGSPMMLNADDLHMLKCDYKILSRYGTGRSFLHRSNRIDIAPEYQVSSYADDVDHGGIQGATAASSYVNIDAETTPDKSGIIYAELVMEIPILTTADIELNYDIRLKGSIFYDAGTYDC